MTLAFDANKTKIASVVKKEFNAQSAEKITRPPGRKLQLQGTQPRNNQKLVHKPVENDPSIIVEPPTPKTSKNKNDAPLNSNDQHHGMMNDFDTCEDNNIEFVNPIDPNPMPDITLPAHHQQISLQEQKHE